MYNIENYLIPYWTGNIMHDESAFVMENEDGSILPIKLLYKPDEILSVTDSTLRITYKEGVDYKLENGVLTVLTEGSIPRMKYSDYYLDEPIEGKSFMRQNGKYLAYAETVLTYPKQIAVTYTHSDKWEGYIPEAQGEKLSRFTNKLENKKPVKILLYGDSISEGANATCTSNREPKMPKFIDLFVNALKKKYGYEDISYVNTSVGGKNCGWGRETVAENALAYDFDLAIIAFGMNNVFTPLEKFHDDIKAIRDKIAEEKPECEFILVATMLPNKELKSFWGNQIYQKDVLGRLADKRTVVANMTDYHASMLEHKMFYDMTGNNVNHPNDFLIRGYAQLLLRTVEKN